MASNSDFSQWDQYGVLDSDEEVATNIQQEQLNLSQPSQPFSENISQNAPSQNTEFSQWDQYEVLEAPETPQQDEDSTLEYLIRTAYSPVSGALNVTPFGAFTNLWQMLGTSEAMDEFEDLANYRIEELKQKFPQAPWENFKGLDREKYQKSLEAAQSTVPTVGNIEKFIESQTGIPLESKTFGQKLLKFMGSIGKFTPGTLGQKAKAATVGGVSKAGLEAVGVPEPVSDIISSVAATKTPLPSRKPVTKPSGLPVKKFESLQKTRKVSPRQYEKITQSVEKDLRDIVDKTVKKRSPTARILETNPNFPKEINETFKKVESLAKEMPGKVKGSSLKKSISEKIFKNKPTGISPSEYDRAYRKEMTKFQRSIKADKDFSYSDMIDQYRKNNKSFGEIYEPGKSNAINRAKQDAYLDFNRAISEKIAKNKPDSELNKLFKYSNKENSSLVDLQRIKDGLDKIFKGKINFKEARKFTENARNQKALERTLGKEGFKEVESIMNDFISQEKGLKLIKQAQAVGASDFVKFGTSWLLNPTLAKGLAGAKGIRFLQNELLSNQKFRLTWNRALKLSDQKKFSLAAKEFEKLNKMVEQKKD